MYYRHHWDRLREIKTRWDPTWYFRFPQGIPPSTEGSTANQLNRPLLIVVVVLIIALSFSDIYLYFDG